MVSLVGLENIIHGIVLLRFDYFNAFLTGLDRSLLSHLQATQSTTARLFTKSIKYTTVTLVLYSLHWLPLDFRSLFKPLVLSYGSLNDKASDCLCEFFTKHSAAHNLKSKAKSIQIVPHTRLKTKQVQVYNSQTVEQFAPAP